MRVKPRPRTNADVDAFIAERWRAGDNARGIMLELMWRGTKLPRHRILAGVKRYVEANSENAGFGKKRQAWNATDIALAAMQLITALMFCGWVAWAIWW